MSVDRSLKLKDALKRHRNVLSRGERVEALKKEDRWEETDGVLGLPKVAHRKSAGGKKSTDDKKAEGAGGAGAAVPAAS
ncbi:MAG TPA: small basic protein [Anaerohalosphaeraceae bacterium]|jgi:small basic protein (TIGR04137 family)|nr:small basic protein [Anaerohalosphaeraceae bacterium]